MFIFFGIKIRASNFSILEIYHFILSYFLQNWFINFFIIFDNILNFDFIILDNCKFLILYTFIFVKLNSRTQSKKTCCF